MTQPEFYPEEPPVDLPTPSIPHSREAEEAVVGAVLINPECYFEVSQILGAEDFYIHRHKWIWEAYTTLTESRAPIDLLTVSDTLVNNNRLAEIGGPAFLTSLVNQVPSSLNATAYASIVKSHAERRKGISFANTLAADAYDTEKPFDLRDRAVHLLQDEGKSIKRTSMKQAASKVIDRVIQHPRFGKWGIPDVDLAVGGLFPAELNILAGYQGTGKSAAKLHAERYNADKRNMKVLDISLEMTSEQEMLRMACGDLKVDINQVRSGHVSSETRGAVISRAAELGEQYEDKIVIYEAPMTLADILAATTIEQPDLVFIDHLGLIEGRPKNTSLMEWYNTCTRFLRQNIAKADFGYGNLNVTLLHQISRAAFRESRRPTKHDLAFAGENDPDGVYLLYRPTENNDPDRESKVKIEWIVDKSRFGWTGDKESWFNLLEQKFYGLTGIVDENEPEQDWQRYTGDD